MCINGNVRALRYDSLKKNNNFKQFQFWHL